MALNILIYMISESWSKSCCVLDYPMKEPRMIRIDSHSTHMVTQTRSASEKGEVDFAVLLQEEAARTAAQSLEQLERDKAAENNMRLEQTAEQDAHDELMRLLQMSPAERIRYQVLKELGLTEESLAQLPFDERMKIEAKIKEEIERQLSGGQRGPSGRDQSVQQAVRL